ncbi:unnamed protein product [Agarophyton chilense]
MASACAVGLASSFGTPIGGVLYALETRASRFQSVRQRRRHLLAFAVSLKRWFTEPDFVQQAMTPPDFMTRHILVSHQHFLRRYSSNIAVLECGYYFRTGIQALSLILMSLTAMVFAGNNSTVEIYARNTAALSLFAIFSICISEVILRDAELDYKSFILRGEEDELISGLQPQLIATDRYP